jgi:pyruvate kinase
MKRLATQAHRDAPLVAEDDAALLAKVVKLAALVRRDGARRFANWSSMIERENFRPAAENLAHYLALRQEDLSSLQIELSERGLSSLGRCEADVLGSLDAVSAALAHICGVESAGFPPRGWKRSRDIPLQEQVEAIFGRDPSGPRSRIMVTLGTNAADDPEFVDGIIAAGADCVRINCAHDNPVIWKAMIDSTRRAAVKLGRDCRVLMDLAGPKVRIAEIAGSGSKRMHLGDRLVCVSKTKRDIDCDGRVIVSSDDEPMRHLKTGHAVLIDDGKIRCVVEGRTNSRVQLRVEAVRPTGVKLRVGKGLNFPDLNLAIPSLTAKDLVDLDFVAANADVVGYSFVQRPDDIKLLQSALAERLGDKALLPLVIKVETRLGVANLPDLIVTAAARQPTAVMIARGDLAVELGLQQMSETQEQLLWLCEAAHVPVVWATQVLDGLLKTGIPSRAEATDAAMGQRAECVMLNKGEYAIDAVRFLDNVLHRMDKHVAKKSALLGSLSHWQPTRSAAKTSPKRSKAK